MPTYTAPGVYIEETVHLPPNVQATDTALPVFIGYTAKAEVSGNHRLLIPTQISALVEYETLFGTGASQAVTLWLNAQQQVVAAIRQQPFCLYDSVRLFFAQGGTQCLIVSVGDYAGGIQASQLMAGLNALRQTEWAHRAATLLVMPEAALCMEAHTLESTMLAHCANAPNRFALFDLRYADNRDDFAAEVSRFRASLGNAGLSYGAAYGPWLEAQWVRTVRLADLTFRQHSTQAVVDAIQLTTDARMQALITEIQALLQQPTSKRTALKLQSLNRTLFTECAQAREWQAAASQALNTLPATGAVAGVYAAMDRERGVWKAPANVTLQGVAKPLFTLNNAQQAEYNVDPNTGKSINLIRAFTGKGNLVWGAKTLAGNDAEWRYIPVRRLFSWVERCINTALQTWTFEANEPPTWLRARTMVENFLSLLWRQGALSGSKPEHAFYVRVGLAETMTAQDIAEGRMILEIGMAVMRPAEFIVIRCTQTLAIP